MQSLRPNGQHERWEPAASDSRILIDPIGWLPSAPCCGSASLVLPDSEQKVVALARKVNKRTGK